MTEELARTKWCPMTRATATHNHSMQPVTSNKPEEVGHSFSCCIASDCMLWRISRDSSGDIMFKDDGYCGLAGKL